MLTLTNHDRLTPTENSTVRFSNRFWTVTWITDEDVRLDRIGEETIAESRTFTPEFFASLWRGGAIEVVDAGY